LKQRTDQHLCGMRQTRYTDYCISVRTNLPIFRLTESKVRRRYSDFDWLRGELERDSKILVPALPGKAVARQVRTHTYTHTKSLLVHDWGHVGGVVAVGVGGRGHVCTRLY
jgi:sorting nexin-3/12